MSQRRATVGRARRPAAAILLCGLLVALALAFGGWLAFGGGSPAAAQLAAGEPTPQTDASVPASHVTMIGSSPGEASDETWGVGQGEAGAAVLVRYVKGSGWSTASELLDEAGQPLAGFKLDQPGTAAPSPLAGAVTPNGSGVLLGAVPPAAGGTKARQVVLVRNPGGAFKETTAVASEGPGALLGAGQELFASNRVPLVAALEESGGQAGALIAPVGGGEEHAVLHWDGKAWTSEPIETTEAGEFHVIGIAASAPANAWLLAEVPAGGFVLFHRHVESGETPKWLAVAPAPGATPGQALSAPLAGGGTAQFRVPSAPTVLSGALTVSGEGVWIDGERSDAHASTTLYFKPQGETGAAAITSWCPPPSGATACENELPEGLPINTKRSFAWANPTTPFGERVISGLPDGVSLRLDGTTFTRVLALGGSPTPNDVGGTYGSAFSNPREGWLGQAGLPVHLTLEPTPSRLTPWPVSFQHALLAVAPQPGAPVGSLSSEALAVGDRGEVARYQPGKGWLPESLLNSSGFHAEPVLRAAAWPTPSRAYAVGNEGQMWLWRSETGLWEQDPATPFNFRGNLIGIAFDPNDPDRGYAVGQGGVLLGYGKTWTQEELPPQVAGASFTSIAFAGSEAIVAYRQLPNPSTNVYTGGLLINDGSGWRIDESAAAVVGRNVPEVVAGLPGGEAAFAASGQEASDVFERSGPGQAWQRTPQPLPGGREPGSLALFKEGEALRVIASGSALNTFSVEEESQAPPGSPPVLIKPYPLEASAESGVLRQTATGWSDEEHELNNVREPAGHFRFYDAPYQPDPVSSVLVDPSGALGWAVGGFVDVEHPQLDTADIDRYPADGVTPVGVNVAPVQPASSEAVFAIGGGAQCAAPCSDGVNAGLGPDVWLSSALSRAGQIAGVRAFFYTGPHVTAGETSGPATVAIPYAREYARYAQLLQSTQLPVYAAASPTDFAGGEGEALFSQAFAGSADPFGGAPAQGPDLAPTAGSPKQCGGSGGADCYYAMESGSAAGTVKAIFVDDSSIIGATQLQWLAGELQDAQNKREAIVVVGNANLNPEIVAGNGEVIALARLLQSGGASAYFFNSPEENIHRPLLDAPFVETFGSGTLGYVSYLKETSEFVGASGFLLAQVHFKEAKPKSDGRDNVTVQLIPNIGELGLEAKEGTLLRRSEAALFQALARRPRAGNRSPNGSFAPETDPYIPIPSNCIGTVCASGLFPEYTFSSSRKDLGDFVEPNLASAERNAVLLGSNGKPIPDSHSGLFCAYNAGTTIVTISTGGLSFSLPVTIQAGSVREPCGTAPLSELKGPEAAPAAPPAPAPAPAPAGPAPAATPTPVPVPALPVTPVAAIVTPPTPPMARPFFLPPVVGSPVLAFVPPPVPTPARPTPPSGTSAVTSPVEAAEKEEESEEATEQVSNQAVAYHSSEHEPSPAYLLGIVLLAAFAGVTVRRRPGRGRRGARVAPATITSLQRVEQRRQTGRRGKF